MALAGLLLILGLTLLLAGGTGLVKGASGIAQSYGVSPLVVGLTVVAFGTSTPELVVNVVGALRGETAIAFGNISGSNLANLGLVLGSAALLTPIVLQGQIIRRELPLLILATSVLLVVVSDTFLRSSNSVIDRADAIILILLFGIFIYMTVSDFMRTQKDPFYVVLNEQPTNPIAGKGSNWLFVAAGMAGLVIGGELSVTNGVKIAELLDVPSVVIGMVVIAIGTSLPELVTSIIAAMRKEADLCVGNVVGSNLFNSLFVLPISALVNPLTVPEGGVQDVFTTLLFTVALIALFIFGRSILSRRVGALFVLAYIAYMSYRVFSNS